MRVCVCVCVRERGREGEKWGERKEEQIVRALILVIAVFCI